MTNTKEGTALFKWIIIFTMVITGGSLLFIILLSIITAFLPDVAAIDKTINYLWDAFSHGFITLLSLLAGKRI